MNPLFSVDSVSKTIGMGTQAFFHSSMTYYNRHHASRKTGRTRIEESNYCYSVAEEEAFLKTDDSKKTDLHDTIAHICETKGVGHFRLIPFNELFEFFWASVKGHFFLFAELKTAIVFFYDAEYCKFIGPLYDSGVKFKKNDCIKRYSLYQKEAFVVDGNKLYGATKETNLH